MKQPIRISLGLASMLAIGFFILGTANEAQATSSGCFLPSFAVSILLADAPDDFVSNRGRCNEQCGKIHTACRRVAHSSAKCLAALFRGEFSFERIGCSEEEVPAECREDLRDDFAGAPQFIRDDHAAARDECTAARDSCRDDCSGEL